MILGKIFNSIFVTGTLSTGTLIIVSHSRFVPFCSFRAINHDGKIERNVTAFDVNNGRIRNIRNGDEDDDEQKDEEKDVRKDVSKDDVENDGDENDG